LVLSLREEMLAWPDPVAIAGSRKLGAGSETGKTGPVVIIQNGIGTTYSPATIAAAIPAEADDTERQ
jgi:mRNA-degrading endonuclease toxin of MazEF toxin-antitoxin module